MNTILCLGVLLGCLHVTRSASTGAKETACAAMYPQHVGTPQITPPPFTVRLTSSMYGCGAPAINVSVKWNDLSGFRGFLCQPRTDVDVFTTFGEFEAINDNITNNCEGEAAATHTDRNLKPSVSFKWLAPNHDVGTVFIVCTVVKNFTLFWYKVSSEGIQYSNTCTTSSTSVLTHPDSTTATTTTFTPISTSSSTTDTNSSLVTTLGTTVNLPTNSSTVSTRLSTNVTLSTTVTTMIQNVTFTTSYVSTSSETTSRAPSCSQPESILLVAFMSYLLLYA